MSARTLEIMLGGIIPIELESIAAVKLVELLGVGGFGSVWKVADVSERIYLLKIIQNVEPDSQMAERVRLEAQVVIPSEHIIPVIGLREWDESTYLILFEYFQGKSLDKILTTKELTKEQKRDVFRQILIGVSDAHRCNIIHRDLKPANILVGDRGLVKIIDFGISKFKDRPLTKGREFLGTIPYIAPELFVYGARVADAQADIYALGHIFYEFITGQHFWVHKCWQLEDFANYLDRIPTPTEGIDLTDFVSDLYTNAASVLAGMVKINPNERFSSVNDVITELGYVPYLPGLPKDLHLRYPLLIVESGSNREARTLVNISENGTLVMGRADLAGSNDSISRRHLEFSRVGDLYFVRDLGSKNGTLLKGLMLQPNDPPTPIQHGDRLKVGDVFLRFVLLKNT
jgi:serine/threonine-protein kinase